MVTEAREVPIVMNSLDLDRPMREPYFREVGAGPGVVCLHSNASSSSHWRTLFPSPNDAYGIRHTVGRAGAALAMGNRSVAAEHFIDFWMGAGTWHATPESRQAAVADLISCWPMKGASPVLLRRAYALIQCVLATKECFQEEWREKRKRVQQHDEIAEGAHARTFHSVMLLNHDITDGPKAEDQKRRRKGQRRPQRLLQEHRRFMPKDVRNGNQPQRNSEKKEDGVRHSQILVDVFRSLAVPGGMPVGADGYSERSGDLRAGERDAAVMSLVLPSTTCLVQRHAAPAR